MKKNGVNVKKFSFSLEKVMDVKEMEKKLIQRKLFTLESDLAFKNKELKKAIEKYEKELCYKDEMMQKKISSNELNMQGKYIESLKYEIEVQNQSIVVLKQEIEKVRASLAEKAKEKKALEILKENKLEDFNKQVKKMEQAKLDDVAAQMKIRGSI